MVDIHSPGVALELVEQHSQKRYDSLESSNDSDRYLEDSYQYLYEHDSVYDVEDEYAIIKSCSSVQINHPENDEEPITIGSKEKENLEYFDVKTPDQNELIVRMHDSGACRKISPIKTGLYHDNKDIVIDDNGDKSKGHMQYPDLRFVSNEEYEMKLLVEQSKSIELSLNSDTDKDETTNTKNTTPVLVISPPSGSKLKDLSTLIRRSFDDVVFQYNGMAESSGDIPLEDIRHISYDDSLPEISSDELYDEEENVATTTQVTYSTHHYPSIVESCQGKKEDTRKISIRSAFWNMKDKHVEGRADSIQPQEYEEYEEEIILTEDIRDESFVEIEDPPTSSPIPMPVIQTPFYEPEEVEMKTMNRYNLNYEVDADGPICPLDKPYVSEFGLHLREETCRYITIKRHQMFHCKHITVAFLGSVSGHRVGQDGGKDAVVRILDVPCEEVIEEVYCHIIDEVVVYEEEFQEQLGMLLSVYDDDWVLLSDMNAT